MDDFLDIEEPTLFRLDRASLIAINGIRDSALIVKAVPNMENFRLLLLFMKLWAKSKLEYFFSYFLFSFPFSFFLFLFINVHFQREVYILG